jgi:hypothetical protein
MRIYERLGTTDQLLQGRLAEDGKKRTYTSKLSIMRGVQQKALSPVTGERALYTRKAI